MFNNDYDIHFWDDYAELAEMPDPATDRTPEDIRVELTHTAMKEFRKAERMLTDAHFSAQRQMAKADDDVDLETVQLMAATMTAAATAMSAYATLLGPINLTLAEDELALEQSYWVKGTTHAQRLVRHDVDAEEWELFRKAADAGLAEMVGTVIVVTDDDDPA